MAALGASSACSSFSSDGESTPETGTRPVDGGGGGTDASTDAHADVDADAGGLVQLTTGRGAVRRLAVRDGALYWAAVDGSVGTCRIDMCEKTARVLAASYVDATSPGGLAVDGSYVYWTGYLKSVVFRTPTSGTGDPTNPERFVDYDNFAGHKPVGIVVDAAKVYWSSQFPDEIRSCPVAAVCGDAGDVVATSPIGFTRGLAANDSHVFWLTGDFSDDAGAVFTATKGGAPADGVGFDIPGPRGIAVRFNAVFVTSWLEPPSGMPAQPGSVFRFIGAGRGTLATGEAKPVSITADDTNAYWANEGDGAIRRCAVGGCNEKPTTIATSKGLPEGITVDADAIYWADSVAGAIFRLPK